MFCCVVYVRWFFFSATTRARSSLYERLRWGEIGTKKKQTNMVWSAMMLMDSLCLSSNEHYSRYGAVAYEHTYTAAVATINSFVLPDCVWPQIVEYTARWIVCHFSFFFFVRCSFRVFPFYIQCTVYSLISSNKHALYRDFSCWSFHWIGWRTTIASV